ncbi:MAG TPA: histidinol-phosphatase [Alphaproteobacteria bacterium]|jgi:inositol-phosphate phosphatase/L-galactose 1-phosphate phosphatase/histidinol-phosphatase
MPESPAPRALETYLRLADRCADAAGDILARAFRTPLEIETKDDASPVTGADREAETAMRTLIAEAFPEHGIVGEELADVNAGAEFAWVLDPIDGTKSFITGKPLFGTLIALTRTGAPVLGVIDQPILHERWRGLRGAPTTLNGAPARVRRCGALGEAFLYATSPHMFRDAEANAFELLRRHVRHALYGADCYAYGLLASGHTDLVVEADLKPYDYLALVPIVEGAGGIITDWEGRPLTLDSGGRVIAAGDPAVHAQALELLHVT